MKRMKKAWVLLFCALVVLSLFGCAETEGARETIEGGYKTYYRLDDGTWECEGQSYQHRLEISGRMPNAAEDSTFVYLSNLESISFERAWKAAGLSSDTEDYFDPEDAVLVELN